MVDVIQKKHSVHVKLPNVKAHKAKTAEKEGNVAKKHEKNNRGILKTGPGSKMPYNCNLPHNPTTVEIKGNSKAKVEAAWNDVQELLDQAKRVMVPLRFKDEQVTGVLKRRIPSISHTLLSTVVLCTQNLEKGESTVLILGLEPDEVTAVKKQIANTAESICVDDSEIVTINQLPLLGRGLSEIEKQFDLNVLDCNCKTGRLTLVGADTAVANALQFINKKLGKSTGSKHIQLAKGQSRFFKEYCSDQFQVPSWLDGIRYSINEASLLLSGP